MQILSHLKEPIFRKYYTLYDSSDKRRKLLLLEESLQELYWRDKMLVLYLNGVDLTEEKNMIERTLEFYK